MAKNRLNLDFSISTNVDRADFVRRYVVQEQFQKHPLTSDELETIANYILYGKDTSTPGKSLVQLHDIIIPTKSKTWDVDVETSLEEMLEQPGFNESQLPQVPTRKHRDVFSRSDARKQPELASLLEPLWRNIDTLDLLINFYDLLHSRRRNPPRETLLARFTPQEQDALREQATHLNQFQYLKRRHLLVDLRRQQYVIRDNFKDTPHSTRTLQRPNLNEDEPTYYFPCGLFDNTPTAKLIFQPFSEMHTSIFSEKDLKLISTFIWDQANQRKNLQTFFDFANSDHLYSLINEHEDFDKHDVFWQTFKYYVENANLSEMQEVILTMKIGKKKNVDIASAVNTQFKKTYTDNYISTIYKQKILTKIAATAKTHLKILENIFFQENFKRCNTCGKWYLIDAENFVRKTRSPDGFCNRCKNCDKEYRQRRKEK